MKKTIRYSSALLLIASFFCNHAMAQKSTIDYDLSDYKLPYLKRNVLELNLDLSGNTSKRIFQFENDPERENTTNNLSSGFKPYYYQYLNSEKFQVYQLVDASLPAFSMSADKRPNFEYITREFNPRIYYTGEFREYLTEKIFLEQDLVFYTNFEKYKNDDKNFDDMGVLFDRRAYQSSSLRSEVRIPILAGWGRIERVEDARLAVYILDDLNKANMLRRKVSDDDISILATRISEVQNERFFDRRDKLIWELQQIDSLLREMDLLAAENIEYFTLLKDNWDYSAAPIRESGFRVSGGIAPELRFDRSKSSTDDYLFNPDDIINSTQNESENTLGLGLIFRLAYEKPLNLYWQLSLSNELSFTKLATSAKSSTNNNAEIETKSADNRMENALGISIAYYPNSRTSMRLYADEVISKATSVQKEPEEDEDLKNLEFFHQTGLLIEYYISPQVRLNMNGSLQLRNSETTGRTNYDNKYLYGVIAAGLTYKIM